MRPFFLAPRALTLVCAALLSLSAVDATNRESPARKIVVIGATARSSQEILWQALATGYTVTAVARNPDQVELRHERLRVLKGDVYDMASIAAALDGDEVVISMVGPRVDPAREVTSMDLFKRGTSNIVAAMKQKGNRRLIVASSLGVENLANVPREKPSMTDPAMMWLWNSRLLYEDMSAMEDLVRRSGLEYVILRPGFILDEPARHDLKFSVDAESPKGRTLTFADFAEFVLAQTGSRRYVGHTVGLYSDRELKFGVNADYAKLSAGMAERAAGQAPPPAAVRARGDPGRGRGLAVTCVPCHGDGGVSASPAFPHIAGQQYDYLVGAMLAYLSGTRQDSIMGGAIRTMSRTDIEDLAAYFAAQRPGGVVAPAASASSSTASSSTAAVGAPAGALAAAQAAADAARALPPWSPRRNDVAGDARERKTCAIAAGGLPGGFAVDADGDGFLGICNIAQWQALAQDDSRWQRNYELVADLDLAGVETLAPVGNCGPANNCMVSLDRHGFAGWFDGNGHTISGLRISRPDQGGIGLFGTVARSGTISGIVLRGAQVAGANGTGLLVGANFGRIAGCDVQGRVEGRVAIGGVAGGNAGRVEQVRAKVEVYATAAVGGAVGDMNGVLTDSTAEVHVRANGKGVGGLVGLSTYGTVQRSRVTGSVTGGDNIGGAVGVNTDALLAEVSAQVDVVATATNAGGLVGYNAQSLVRDARALGTVRGVNAVGGLVGRNIGAIVTSFATGKVTGEAGHGPLVGDNAQGTVHASVALEHEERKMPAALLDRWDKGIWAFNDRPGRLPQLRRLPVVAMPAEDAVGPLQNTVRAFRRGDVFVAATVMNDPQDDHAGTGRLLQYDSDLNYVGEIWLQGTRHKVGGLAFGPDRTLWAMAQLTPAVIEIDPRGRQRPYRHWSDRKLSSVTFAPNGSLYFGEHMAGTLTGHPSITTKFQKLPGRDVIGDGHLFQYTRNGRLLREFATPTHGGVFGFLGNTSTVLTTGGRRLVYLSETSNVVKQYDLAGDRPLPDLARFDQDPSMPMVIVMNAMPDGRLVISNAIGFALLDPSSGQVLRHYRLEGTGWAAINGGIDNAHVYVGNFWTGELVKVRLFDGAVVARTRVGQRESLSGVAQFPG